MTLAYPALIEPGDDGLALIVSFPDVPEAITEGDTREEALENAVEALGLALLTYPRRNLPLPVPGETRADLVPVSVAPATAAKLAVLDTFREAGISKTELSRRMNLDEKEVRRILDPVHATKIGKLDAALAALGRRMVLTVVDAA
uniref:type II toxin-antitoxin system HicB family antitoxin n=1 Tax=Stappia sp. TaxID=1870903 RepID=UPI003BACAB70